MTYDAFFEAILGHPGAGAGAPPGRQPLTPYRYQRRLAAEPWPDILDIPPGLGKTAAVTGAWLYRHRSRFASI